MQTKRDQLQAYMFVVGRVKAAVLRANPDAASIPFKRSTSSTIVGIIVTVLVAGICVVIGLLFPGSNTGWQSGTDVVLAEETGSRYVLLGGALHPILNYSSAKLILGAKAGVVSVAAASLGDTPRGVPIGIPGAPDALPAPDQLLTAAPMACSQSPSGSAAPGARPRLVVVGGVDVPTAVTEDAVLVQGPDDDPYLAWQGQRFRVVDRSVPASMGLAVPRRVPLSWLNTLLPRADLTTPEIPGRGQFTVIAPGVGQLRSGQVLTTTSVAGDTQYLVVLPDGLAPVTQLTAALIGGDPRTVALGAAGASTPEISRAVVASLPASTLPGVPTSWPETVPAGGIGPRSALCTVLPAGSGPDDPPQLLTTDADALAAAVGRTRDADRDLIAMRPGSGLLAQAAAVPGASNGALYFVSDLGVRHAIPSAQVADALGLSAGSAVGVSAELLAGIPEGPALDPVAALTPQPAESSRGSS